MKFLGKYWKVILALVLVIAAVVFYFTQYRTEKMMYVIQATQLEMLNEAMEKNIEENTKYAGIQNELADAIAELNASRRDLYELFPVEMKEEDQIMYVLYLETLFKEEIFFSFNLDPVSIALMADGSKLQYLELKVNYRTTYQGFKDMLTYLSTDSRFVSIHEATIDYDVENDLAMGGVTLWIYLMDSDSLEYVKPDVAVPETSKENVYENRSVWVKKNDSKYHSDSECGKMKDPDEITLEEARNRGLTACPKCHVLVWVEKYGSTYHGDKRCSAADEPILITLEEAIILGRTVCSECADTVELYEIPVAPIPQYVTEVIEMVWVSQSGEKYHTVASCSNMVDPVELLRTIAEELGYIACSKCYN